jgi:hypothetical protein
MFQESILAFSILFSRRDDTVSLSSDSPIDALVEHKSNVTRYSRNLREVAHALRLPSYLRP